MRVTSDVDYKGTAFGDPARSLSQNTTNKLSTQSAKVTDIGKLNSNNAKSYPVQFKGTAIGDPAKFNSPVTYDKSSSKQVVEIKGNKIDVSL